MGVARGAGATFRGAVLIGMSKFVSSHHIAKAQVTSTKTEHKKRGQFLAHFLIPF